MKAVQKILFFILILFCAFPAKADTRQKQTITGPSSLTVTVNQKVTPEYTAKTSKTLTIQDTSIARLSEGGTITGRKSGKTYLVVSAKATSRYLSAVRKIPLTVKCAAQKLQAEDLLVGVGKTELLVAKSSSSRSYRTSDSSICVVDKNGNVTGKNVGTAYVTVYAKATSMYLPASLKVKVTVAEPSKLIPVILRDNTGKLIRTDYVARGGRYTFPGMRNTDTYSFLGWSRKAKQIASDSSKISGLSVPGDVVTNITVKQTFYMVITRKMTESVPGPVKLNTRKYSTVIFVGDSRMAETCKLVRAQPDYTPGDTLFITKYGQGLSWLKEEAYATLERKIDIANSKSTLPAAVVMCLGVNDMENASGYISFLNSMAKNLSKKNCRLFFNSVNPVNSEQIRYMNSIKKYLKMRSEQEVKTFNKAMKNGLNKAYTYIDCWCYLMNYGFNTHALDGLSQDDGLHYTPATSLRAFNFIMKKVNAS